jgi:hypothetical protein
MFAIRAVAGLFVGQVFNLRADFQSAPSAGAHLLRVEKLSVLVDFNTSPTCQRTGASV